MTAAKRKMVYVFLVEISPERESGFRNMHRL